MLGLLVSAVSIIGRGSFEAELPSAKGVVERIAAINERPLLTWGIIYTHIYMYMNEILFDKT